jgi:hypothetical protein
MMEQVNVAERSQPKNFKPKIRGPKLSGVYWQEALKQKGIK